MTLRPLALAAAGLLVLALTLAACSPLTLLNATVPRGTHTDTLAVAYGADPRQRLDVYRPAASAPPGGYPVVLFFHGGSWNRGERADYRFVGEALASRGIVAVLADYRLYPQVRYPDFLEDCARALATTLDDAGRYGGNPRRVFVAGHSAGAYNAAMLALDRRWLAAQGHAPEELAGWIGLAGPYDFLPIRNPEVKPVFYDPDYPAGSQPITHANAAAPRSFLAAARSDSLVDPVRNTGQLAARLRQQGVPVSLQFYDHVDHLTLAGAFARPLRGLAPVLDDMTRFVLEAPASTR